MRLAYIAEIEQINNHESIGANAIILPNCRIGEEAVVGVGSVVTKDVSSYEVVAGNPAKFIKKNHKKYNFKIL
jgi:acetyltransferase-like isoleucine patch superfamily enzyme